MLTLVAGQDEVKAFYVCRVIREELHSVLTLCTSQTERDTSYLHSTVVVLLCRLVSVDVCLSALLMVDQDTSMIALLISTATSMLEKVLSVPRKDAASIKCYDRHCFGLYITLLVYVTNTEVQYIPIPLNFQ